MLDRGIKLIVLSFASFMHYVVTMLVFFVPIDIAHKVFDVPQMIAILFGTLALWIFSMVTGAVILKTVKTDERT
jgi:EamA domain-containing membrane protein RarD